MFRPLDPVSAVATVSALASLLAASGAMADWPASPLTNVPICVAPGFQQAPRIVTDGAGGGIIVWSDQRNGAANQDLFATRVLANGTVDPAWPVNGHPICTASGGQFNGVPESDGAGGAFLVWQDQRSGTSDIYVHHILRDIGPNPAWPVSGLPVCTADSIQHTARLAVDGTGGAFVSWLDRRTGVLAFRAHHVLGNGVLDPTWPADGVVLDAGPVGGSNALLADGLGGAITVWAHGADFDLRVLRLLPDGVDPAWAAGGIPLCSAAGAQGGPLAVSDGSGGALVAWADFRTGTPDVYGGHVLAGGVVDPTWPVDGRALCVATGSQTLFAMSATGPGEAIVAWRHLSGTAADVYALRTSGPGGSWPVDGLPLCTLAGSQDSPSVCSDGFDGAIVAWQDRRSTTADMYAQRVLADGQTAWTASGVAVSTANFNQERPEVLADGAGGAIIVWQDDRAGNYDIYAQRLQPNGQLGGTVVGVPDGVVAATHLDRVIPNPSHGGALRIGFTLTGGRTASLELVDVGGRRALARNLGRLAPGRHSVELDAAGLASGVYVLVLREGEATHSRRIAIVE
jgi:hypothetical protein